LGVRVGLVNGLLTVRTTAPSLIITFSTLIAMQGVVLSAAISSVVVGGFCSVMGIFIGTLTFAIVIQGIYFTPIDRNWSNLIIGVTLLVAMAMNENFRRMALTYSPRKT
jgi:ribose/xylose/arabinose/galactoside ABC-type transport system permease subunit